MARAQTLQRVTLGLVGDTSVLACALDRRETARLADAMGGRSIISVVPSFAELPHQLRSSTRTVDVVVLPARDALGESAHRTIREIASERPRTAIVVYCHADWQHDTDLRALASAGAHQFVFGGANDRPVDFRAVILSARSQCAAECVFQLLASCIPAPLHPMVEAVLSRPQQIMDVGSLAAALGVHRRTLFNRCTRTGFLGPAELVSWVRLTLAGYLLETTGCTIETISIDLSYPSPTALRNAMKRYTGHKASEVRVRGGSSAVIQALRARVRTLRQGNRLHMV